MKKALLVAVAAATLVGCSKSDEQAAITSIVSDNNSDQSTERRMDKVRIGTQTWSLTNLSVAKYQNGDPIPQVTNPEQWDTLTTGAWCWYNNDSANYSKYGRLYNWYAVHDPRGLAPRGWHVPTNQEWDVLTKHIEPSADTSTPGYIGTVVGNSLKSTVDWGNGGVGTNSSGFTALPGGIRVQGGVFGAARFWGIWWAVGNPDPWNGWYRLLHSNTSQMLKERYTKSFGLSVRVVKD